MGGMSCSVVPSHCHDPNRHRVTLKCINSHRWVLDFYLRCPGCGWKRRENEGRLHPSEGLKLPDGTIARTCPQQNCPIETQLLPKDTKLTCWRSDCGLKEKPHG